MNEFFDKVVCLTQERRYDRQQFFQREAEKYGFEFEYHYAIECDDPVESFCFSMKDILLKNCALNNFLVVEDDCNFRLYDRLGVCFSELPNDWDLFYLGGNCTKAKKFSKNLRRVKYSLCTHAVAYTGKAAKEIAEGYEMKEGQLFDTWLAECYQASHECYIAYPMIAIQRPVYSDLWSRDVDYLDIWDSVDNYLWKLST
jgi:hypothetical protein